MIKPTKIYIIVNELSGSGNGKKVSIALSKQLIEKNIAFNLYPSQYAGHTVQLAKDLSKEHDTKLTEKKQLLLIIGGDGTLNEALTGLGETQKHIPLAYIPAGSGNDFAKALSISKDVAKALEQLLICEEPKEINILHYHDQISGVVGYAVNNIGVGFDGATANFINESSVKKKLSAIKMGSLTYLVSLIIVLFKQKGFPIKVKVGNVYRTFSDAFLVTVNNHPYFGGGMEISPKASPYDDVVDLIVLQKVSLFKFIFLFILMLNGGRHLNHKDVHYLQGPCIKILSNQQEYVQADGEFLGKKSLDLSIKSSTRYFWIQ
ncbi:MAG: diacylglycerol kinase family lipid kinase [Carnobacterium sp.]|nr:diacylglycerol kinase family lipid kinase [Carnobacterium sp.]